MTIKIDLTTEEHRQIKAEASKRRLTLKEYGRMKLLDSTEGAENLSRQIMRGMPTYYTKTDEITDPVLREWFVSYGGRTCQILQCFIK